jgi:hypothetical protein
MSFLKRVKKGKGADEEDKSGVPTEPATTANIIDDTTGLVSTEEPSQSSSTNIDDDTVVQSGNSHKATVTTSKASNSAIDTTIEEVAKTPSSKKARSSKTSTPGSGFVVSLAEELRLAQEQITLEKAGKRKLFHSLVKVANELRKTREQQAKVEADIAERNKQWYTGGLWRAPQILPGIEDHTTQARARQISQSQQNQSLPTATRLVREAISLSDLFFHLVIVTAFTRVGVGISNMGYVDLKSFLYFGIFWNIWSKEASYTSRFDTTDLSAQMENLVTCFAVLFGSLSVQADINSIDCTRIMIMASAVAILHCALHIRVAISNWRGLAVSPAILTTDSERAVSNPLTRHVFHYAMFTILVTTLEAITWLIGVFVFPTDWPYRWCVVIAGIVFGLRVPRAFLANDFHGKLAI